MAEEAPSIPQWSLLPVDLLTFICDRYLYTIFDRIRLSGVCSSWRAAALAYERFPSRQRPLPWLLLPADDRYSPIRSFLIVQDINGICQKAKICLINLPEFAGRYVHATSHGWLVLTGGHGQDRNKVLLIHPFNRKKIHLPPYPSTREYHYGHVKKAVLSSNPSKREEEDLDDVFVGLWLHNQLSYCRVGVEKEQWFFVSLETIPDSVAVSFAYHRRAFYFLHRGGEVVRYALSVSIDEEVSSPSSERSSSCSFNDIRSLPLNDYNPLGDYLVLIESSSWNLVAAHVMHRPNGLKVRLFSFSDDGRISCGQPLWYNTENEEEDDDGGGCIATLYTGVGNSLLIEHQQHFLPSLAVFNLWSSPWWRKKKTQCVDCWTRIDYDSTGRWIRDGPHAWHSPTLC